MKTKTEYSRNEYINIKRVGRMKIWKGNPTSSKDRNDESYNRNENRKWEDIRKDGTRE